MPHGDIMVKMMVTAYRPSRRMNCCSYKAAIACLVVIANTGDNAADNSIRWLCTTNRHAIDGHKLTGTTNNEISA